ncbi:hypothetical protein BDN67DRAFT_1001060 [Paxillus ammoniavirescens]|nr:hypothetical protein BDN67DRAFT_1001060 [Paxillus ammoniavirescens]
MGQSVSRRRPPPTSPTPPQRESESEPESFPTPQQQPGRSPSLPHRLLSSLPKPSLRARTTPATPTSAQTTAASTSNTLPISLPIAEQTLRGKKRRWTLSRRNKSSRGDDPDRSHSHNSNHPSAEQAHEENVRAVDEFGVISDRVNESQSIPDSNAKGKARQVQSPNGIDEEDPMTNPSPIASSSSSPPAASSTPPPVPNNDHDESEVVIAPPQQTTSLPIATSLPTQPAAPRFISPLPIPAPAPAPQPSPSHLQPSAQQTNINPRHFPPPGTLVVVQGVVHTSDVPRPSEGSSSTTAPSNTAVPTSTSPNANSNTNGNRDGRPTRPSSVPPRSGTRNRLSGILPRPSSMLPAVPSSSPVDVGTGSSNNGTQSVEDTESRDSAEETEDEGRGHTHGVSIAQGPVGASGLSASSIDVLGTLLSVAAAATAASLLTGSSEPIFSSGLTSSPPQPSPTPASPSSNFTPGAQNDRPLSPTPTSDAGRMRHVWSSLRDRLGLGGGANSSSTSANDITPGSGAGQGRGSQGPDIVRPRDAREIMLAEMARAFNLGLGLGGSGANATPVASANSNTADVSAPAPTGQGGDGTAEGEEPPLPPPDSFERFLMDLQTDLRVALMQEHEPSNVEDGYVPTQHDDEGEEDEDDDGPMPELRSVSDSDSEEFESRQFDSDHDDELDPEEGVDEVDEEEDEEDAHTAHEQLSGRTSPAVSALGTGAHSPFGVRPGLSSRAGSFSSFHTSVMSPSAAITHPHVDSNSTATDNDKAQHVDAVPTPRDSGVAVGIGSRALDQSDTLETGSTEVLDHREEAVVGAVSSLVTSNGVEVAECTHAVEGAVTVPTHGSQDPSNAAGSETSLGLSSLLGTSPSSAGVIATGLVPTLSTGVSTPSSAPESPAQLLLSSAPPVSHSRPGADTIGHPSATNANEADTAMPFRLPFTPSSASRTERTPGGGINWWRMYRFPAITSPVSGQQQGPQGSQSPSHSQSPSRTDAHGPNFSSSSSPRTESQNQQSEVVLPRGEERAPGVLNGVPAPVQGPPRSSATPTNMPETVSASNASTTAHAPANGTGAAGNANGQNSTNANASSAEHRGNVVVPVIVVGLQSVNMDRQPHTPHPHAHHHHHHHHRHHHQQDDAQPTGDEDGEGMDFDGFGHPMSMPMHIPEPPEFHDHPHHSHPSRQQQQQEGQQQSRGRTWQTRAANAFRNLRPSRRNMGAASPQPADTPGSRTFLIYVIGGYYPPDHQIITGGNLDSFEALWELAELLGQVKPPTVSKEDIEKSGLEIIKASMLEEYEKQGRVANNCIDRCLICLDDYDPEDELRVLSCRHTFHQGCVDRWLETGRNNCPACRSKGVNDENATATAGASTPTSATPSAPAAA